MALSKPLFSGTQCAADLSRHLGRLLQLVLPHANHAPTGGAQFAANAPIALPVGRNLCVPELAVAAGPFVTLRAAVPKATVHKHDNPLASEGEIRFAEQRLVAPPPGDAELAEDFDEAQLGGFVSARADQRHNFRAFLFAPNIAQNSTGPNF